MAPWHILPKSKRTTSITVQPWFVSLARHRPRSTATSNPPSISDSKHIHLIPSLHQKALPALSVMPTRLLLRTLMITWLISSPRLVNLSIPIMHRISYSPSWLLNPDRNPMLHHIVRRVFYDHFCAGENDNEVGKTIRDVKAMGFEGVILGFAKESLADETIDVKTATISDYDERVVVEQWKRGTLQTLVMLGPGDFLAIKFTGAGPVAIEAMIQRESPPPLILAAITEICDQASRKNTRIWIDAEQQIFQHAIDEWTIQLMRKYNRNGKVIIYNTLQAYLKGTPTNVARHLSLAQEEGWGLGIKLVRGAYIMIEERKLIHDTIEETHAAYNDIVRNLLCKEFPGVSNARGFPHLQLFLASHNAESVKAGYEMWKERKLKGLSTIKLEIGQLQGMADEVSCGLIQVRQQMASTGTSSPGAGKDYYPRAFKCLCWGSARECVQFLVRRVVENRGSLDRTKSWLAGLKRELWRRIKASVKNG